MAIENLNALKPSAELVHMRHFRDGYPLCWSDVKDVDFEVSSLKDEVSCQECLDIIREGHPYAS